MRALPFLLLFAAVAGCGKPALRYKLEGDWSKVRSPRQGAKVAVLTFRDERPERERKPGWSIMEHRLKDADFKGASLAAAVSDAVARHLDQCRLFGKTEFVARPVAEPLEEMLPVLRGAGYDAVLVGTMAHFTAMNYIPHPLNPKWYYNFSLGYFLGWVPGLGEEFHDIEVSVELRDLRLVGTRDAAVLWSGGCAARKSAVLGPSPQEFLIRATLEEAVWGLVRQLEDVEVPEIDEVEER